MEYEDFEVQIGPRSGEGFLVRVLRSPAGEGEALVRLPEALAYPGSRDLQSKASVQAPSPAQLGGRLFQALFVPPISTLFHQSLSLVQGEPGRGLRLRLRINPRDESVVPLQRIPWELLYREDTEDFLALSRTTPVVRSLDIPRPSRTETLERPLRILVVPSPDVGGGGIDLERELRQLRTALQSHRDIEIEILERPDIQVLRAALCRATFHAIHYMGHGTFDSRSGEGALVFQNPDSPPALISGRHLATATKDFASLRLVVLNACSTAVSSSVLGHSPFAGVAAALVLGGVPAVLAMQSPVQDSHATAFSAAFYDRLVRGRPLEEAVTEGRQAILSLNPQGPDWAIPVLFLRTSSGDLFASKTSPPDLQTPNVFRRSWRQPAAGALVLLMSTASMVTWSRGRDQPVSGPWEPVRENALTPLETSLAVPPADTPTEPVPTARKTEPKPDPVPSEPERATQSSAKVGFNTPTGDGFRFDVSADRSISSALQAALREGAASLRASGLPGGAGWTVRVEVDAPQLSTHDLTGGPATTCRLAAACQARGAGTTLDLGTLRAMGSHVDSSTACDRAAASLAGVVVRKLAQSLKEEENP